SGGEEETPATTEETTAEPEPENFVVTDDIIVSSSYVPENYGFAQACSPSRMFVPEMVPVFKIGVYDPETGDVLGNDTLDSVSVNIDGYETVDLAWGGDAEEDPADEWGGSWTIPEDAEPGEVSYTVEVTGGDDANFTNVGILESSFTIIEYSRNLIIRDDVYTGSAGIPEDNAFVSSCQPERLFAPGMMVGFDVAVYEGATGNPVGPTDSDIEDVVAAIESVTISFEERDQTVECEWAATENDDGDMVDFYWNGTWTIPEDAETGSITYTIDVETDDTVIDTPGDGAHTQNTFEIVSE
ncbi:MAG: hypothetical protein ACOCRC_02410, partial [Halodesulfurarchaeum sp.]